VKIKFYLKSSGRSPVEEFLRELPETTRLEVFDAIAQLEAGKNLEMPLSKNLSGLRSGLHELRFRDKAGQVRVIYFIKRGDAIYILHAYRKKTQTISLKDMDLILKRLKEI